MEPVQLVPELEPKLTPHELLLFLPGPLLLMLMGLLAAVRWGAAAQRARHPGGAISENKGVRGFCRWLSGFLGGEVDVLTTGITYSHSILTHVCTHSRSEEVPRTGSVAGKRRANDGGGAAADSTKNTGESAVKLGGFADVSRRNEGDGG